MVIMLSNFINEAEISDIIEKSRKPDSKHIDEILAHALEMKGISFEETAALLSIDKPEDLEKLFHTAYKVKEEIYGRRLVLFAPLYVSNYCANSCLYCGFRADNTSLHRSMLDMEQIKDETLAILEQGHKRALMLMGEHHKNYSLDKFIEAIQTVYSVRDSKGSRIRRINVEIAPLSNEEFQKFNQIPIGTYTVFQETYHRETYKAMHPSGKKSDYDWRVQVMDRALSNGMHDVGIGALFGLYDYRFEVLGLIQHSMHLDKEFGVGPHTISIPRIKPANNAPASHDLKYAVTDDELAKVVAVLRLSVPYTGMILSTREPAELRTKLCDLGISQISAGSKTNPGGYKQAFNDHHEEEEQFSLNDSRTASEVIKEVIKHGYIPSFCTGCYRKGRVGADFMDQAKPGLIKLFCQPNGLTTLKEYLVDYADAETRAEGDALIQRELEQIPNEKVKQTTIEYLSRIEKGERGPLFVSMAIDDILNKPELKYLDLTKLLSITDADEKEKLRSKAEQTLYHYVGNKVYLRGLIEFSNVCTQDCFYCGIRKSNPEYKRYTLSKEEILESAMYAARNNYGSIVLQSGERSDQAFVDNICDIVETIKSTTKTEALPEGLGITLCVGEQTEENYRKFFSAGAHRYLLRIETTNPQLFSMIHPGDQTFERRLESLDLLKQIGFQVGTGVMIGLPNQTAGDLANDILFFKKFDIDMIGMGPFIPHANTPMQSYLDTYDYDKWERYSLALKMIAVTRLALKDVNIASTTALQVITDEGREEGLRWGANVVMPQITPTSVRHDYQLYQDKPCMDDQIDQCHSCMRMRIKSIGPRNRVLQLGRLQAF